MEAWEPIKQKEKMRNRKQDHSLTQNPFKCDPLLCGHTAAQLENALPSLGHDQVLTNGLGMGGINKFLVTYMKAHPLLPGFPLFPTLAGCEDKEVSLEAWSCAACLALWVSRGRDTNPCGL